MKRRRLLTALIALAFGSSLAGQPVPAPTPVYAAVTLKRTLEIIAGAKREVWLLAPTLRNPEVYKALRSRVQSGVILRLLIANRAGYMGLEVNLARTANVDARWLKEKFASAMLVVDDRAAIISPILSGIPSPGQSIEISRPEVVAPMTPTLKQLFSAAKRVR
jgi:phosphatidylserine/phosphatidylglycerophosphate/cardiolipin synthase-like enzyme